MFSFFNDMDNYEERKVARYEKDDIRIDTCYCSDTEKPIETAISHPNYNDGKWIIVDYADTKKEALLKHNKWVKKMTSEKLPEQIKDVSTAGITSLRDLFGNSWRNMEINNK